MIENEEKKRSPVPSVARPLEPILTVEASVVLMDIEGTTTSLSFVHDVLFPYSLERLDDFLRHNSRLPVVREALKLVHDTVGAENGDPASTNLSLVLADWIRADRKHPGLKLLQGEIWRSGYASNVLHGHVYPDVPASLQQWTANDVRLAIYSSGSVAAQRLLFGHSIAGDLTPLFSAYFDTAVGGKREERSYHAIVRELAVQAGRVVFLSDTPEELMAAKSAGLQTVQLLRQPDMRAHPGFAAVRSFSDLLIRR